MGKKKKAILPPQLPPDVPEEEIDVSDDDLAFVNENLRYASFLTNLDTNLINRHVTRVADYKEDELEALYEKRKKKAALKKEVVEGLQVDRVDALPIKTLEGELCYRTAEDLEDSKTAHKENGSTSEVKENDIDKALVRLTKAERRQKLKKSKKEAKKQAKEGVKAEGGLHSDVLAKVEEDLSAEDLFAKKKIKIAEVGMALLENPETHIKSLKELLHICSDEDHNIVKLGLMSLLAVFKDIIPGYRIRLPTEKELEMKVSKEVLQTRFYESTLLNSYKAYLQKLIALEKDPIFHCVAVRCMCSLLDAVPHFNFRENLVAAVIRNISSSVDVVRKLCCDTIRSVFTNEGKHGGQVTLEAVRLIAELVKAHYCQLHPDSIEVFLSLVFDEDLGKSEPKEMQKEKLKKKRRKQQIEQSNLVPMSDGKKRKLELMTKTREELSADLKSVSFAPDREEQRRIQSEILSAVFETYFRILKHSVGPSSPRSTLNDTSVSIGPGQHPLLGPCLMGLGKFSHLIDLDFMGDLMGCLKKLSGYNDSYNVGTSSSLTVSEKLQCCIVAFRVMRNNLDALNVDLQEFSVQLYNLLLEYRPFSDRGDVLAEALKTMLWEGKQHDMHRAAAFVKRLATFALSFGSSDAMAALVTLKHLLLRNSKCRSLLENDPGGGSLSGLVVKYNPDASDPHLSGALASVLWELSLLSKHHNPSISGMASGISNMTAMNPSQTQAYLSTISPSKAFEDSTIERELHKAVNTKSSFNRKGKRGSEFVIMDAKHVRSLESPVDEDAVKNKFEEHFVVLREIDENEKLRLELSRTASALRLYKEYKKQRNLTRKQKPGRRKEGFVSGAPKPQNHHPKKTMATLRQYPASLSTYIFAPKVQIPRISSSLLPTPLPLRRRSFSSLKISIPKRHFAGRGSAAGATMIDSPASSYALALAEVAKSNDTLDATMADMENIETVFSNSSVQSFFANPTISDEKKLDVINDVAASANLKPHTTNFLNILIDMKRIDLINEIVEEFTVCYNEMTGTEVAIVSSVVKLEPQHITQIAKTVQRLTGAKNVRIKTAIDSSLVAGFTVRYGNSGSKLIDLSVKKQLDEIVAQLDFSSVAIA